jgi:hypothetical protein
MKVYGVRGSSAQGVSPLFESSLATAGVEAGCDPEGCSIATKSSVWPERDGEAGTVDSMSGGENQGRRTQGGWRRDAARLAHGFYALEVAMASCAASWSS